MSQFCTSITTSFGRNQCREMIELLQLCITASPFISSTLRTYIWRSFVDILLQTISFLCLFHLAPDIVPCCLHNKCLYDIEKDFHRSLLLLNRNIGIIDSKNLSNSSSTDLNGIFSNHPEITGKSSQKSSKKRHVENQGDYHHLKSPKTWFKSNKIQ